MAIDRRFPPADLTGAEVVEAIEWCRDHGRMEAAADLARLALAVVPGDAAILLLSGDVRLAAGDLKGAAKAYDQARQAGAIGAAISGSVQVAKAREQWVQVEELVPQAVAAGSPVEELIDVLLLAGFLQGKDLQEDPSVLAREHPAAWSHFHAQVLERSPGFALPRLTAARGLFPDDPDLGLLEVKLISRHDPKGAIARLRQWQGDHPDDESFTNLLADLEGRVERAATCAVCKNTRQCHVCSGSGTCQQCQGGSCPDCTGGRCQACTDGKCHDCGGSGKRAFLFQCSACERSGTCQVCHGHPLCPTCRGQGACLTCKGVDTCRHCRGTGACQDCSERP